MWGNSSWPLPFGHGVLPASAPDFGHGVAPLGRAGCSRLRLARRSQPVTCIGTWNVRSTNQGKLEVVKQEMARVNIDILGISELKWTGMGEFNSDDHHIYYCGQESLRRSGVAIMVNKRV